VATAERLSSAELVADAIGAAHGQGVSEDERRWSERIDAVIGGLEGAGREITWVGDAADGSAIAVTPIVRVTSVPIPWGLLLMRLAESLAPARVLELGTAFGISSSYLAAGLELAGGDGRVTTVERQPGLVEIAGETHRELGLDDRIERIESDFSSVLADLLAGPPPDLVYVDDDHRGVNTLELFEKLVPKIAPGGLLVYDDVHWSQEMTAAWAQISRDGRLAFAIDLGRPGICAIPGNTD
jgi:predicted O-methyltransferase YrrM